MSRIPTPQSIESAPEASQALLLAVQRQLGTVPNLFRIVGNSPQALEGYLGLNGALTKGALSAPTRERIALAVAQINGCDYCLAAHSYLGKNLAKLSEEEIRLNREGTSLDTKAAAAVEFAALVTERRGKVTSADINAIRAAGYTDAEVVEIVAHVALNTLTNYMNEVLGTEIDFPVVDKLEAA